MPDSRKSLPKSCALAIWVFLGFLGSSYAGPLKPIEKDNTGNAPASLADLVARSALASPPTLAAVVSDQLGDPFASLSYLNDDGIAPERVGGDDIEQRYRFTLLAPADASEAPDAATPARPTGQVAPPEPARPGTTVTWSAPNTRPRLAALLPSREVSATGMPSLPATSARPSLTPPPRVAFPWPVPTSRAPAARRFQQTAPRTTPPRTRASRPTALRVVGLRLALPPTAARRPFDANELEIGLMPGSKADRLANFLEDVSRGDTAGERSRDMWNFSFAEIVNGWARAGRHGELTLDRVARGTISRHEQSRRRDMVRTLRKLDGSGTFAF